MKGTSVVTSEHEVVRPAPGIHGGEIALAAPPGTMRSLVARPQAWKLATSVAADWPNVPESDADKKRPGPAGNEKSLPPKSTVRSSDPEIWLTANLVSRTFPAAAVPGWLPVTLMLPTVYPVIAP